LLSARPPLFLFLEYLFSQSPGLPLKLKCPPVSDVCCLTCCVAAASFFSPPRGKTGLYLKPFLFVSPCAHGAAPFFWRRGRPASASFSLTCLRGPVDLCVISLSAMFLAARLPVPFLYPPSPPISPFFSRKRFLPSFNGLFFRDMRSLSSYRQVRCQPLHIREF